MDHDSCTRLSDDDLLATVERLTQSEREASATLVAHLAKMSRRRLHERLGYPSLYMYCVEVLRLSPDEAYDRMKAAAARRFPQVLSMLAERALSLSSIRLLAPHLKRENHEELLAEARNKSRREVQALLALRFPQPDVPATIRPLPPPALPPQGPLLRPAVVHTSIGSGELETDTSQATDEKVVTTLSSVTQADSPPPVLRPLSPERFHIAFTGDSELVELIELARDLLRHAVPGGDLAQNLRDLGRCTFVGAAGHRCQERGFVEFHHLVPYAMSGPSTVENLCLLCRTHNQLEGELYFGARGRDGESEVGERSPTYDCGHTHTFSVRNENVSSLTRATATA